MLATLSIRNKRSMPDGVRHNAALLPAFGTGLSLLSALIGVPAARSATTGYQTYKDAAAGFALSKPDGWHVRNEGTILRVESPDSSELVLMRAFTPEPEQTATQWLQASGENFSAMFPHLSLDHSQHVETPASGDEIIAEMHYQGPKGQAKAHVLCRVKNGKGLLYVLAAPAARYRAEQSKMVHVAQSIAFLAPRNSDGRSGRDRNSGSGRNSGNEMSTEAQVKATERSVHWVTWSDPREHAFHLSIPQGWTAQGGIYRDGENGANANIFYSVVSPRKDIVVIIGSPRMLAFQEVSQPEAAVGMRDGQDGRLHYMRAPEFNQMYLNDIFSKSVDDLTVVKGQELEAPSRQASQQMRQQYGGMMETVASVGVTDFKGTDKATGKPMSGIVLTMTQGMRIPNLSTSWFAFPMYVGRQVGDAQEESRARLATAVFQHVQDTFAQYPEWTKRRQRELDAQADRNNARGRQMVADAGERSKQISAQNDAAMNAIMGRYSSHVAAGNAQQNAFVNHIGDRTDVTNGAGQTFNVGSGYSHYYQGNDGTIVGTNSAYNPGVDFTPMTEH